MGLELRGMAGAGLEEAGVESWVGRGRMDLVDSEFVEVHVGPLWGGLVFRVVNGGGVRGLKIMFRCRKGVVVVVVVVVAGGGILLPWAEAVADTVDVVEEEEAEIVGIGIRQRTRYQGGPAWSSRCISKGCFPSSSPSILLFSNRFIVM